MSYTGKNSKFESITGSGGYSGYDVSLYGNWQFDQNITAPNLSGINTGDQTLSGLTVGAFTLTIGTATLIAGDVTVSTAAVTSSSKIFITASSSSTGLGTIRTGNIVDSTSFDIISLNILDDATVDYLIITPN